MPKFYIIMKHTFQNEADKKAKAFRKAVSEGITEPDNAFPFLRSQRAMLQKAETNPLVLYWVHSTSY